MSVGSPIKQTPAERRAARLHWVRANIGWCFAVSGRPSKFAVTPVWRALLRLAVGSVAGIAVVAATMILVDAPAVTAAQRAPSWLIQIFNHVTEFGKSFWFLVPIALALAMIALLATPAFAAKHHPASYQGLQNSAASAPSVDVGTYPNGATRSGSVYSRESGADDNVIR